MKGEWDKTIPPNTDDYFEWKVDLDSIKIKNKKNIEYLSKIFYSYEKKVKKEYSGIYPNYAFVILNKENIDTLFLDSSLKKGYFKQLKLEVTYSADGDQIFSFFKHHYPKFIKEYTYYHYKN